jgi:hypothetical protein
LRVITVSRCHPQLKNALQTWLKRKALNHKLLILKGIFT